MVRVALLRNNKMAKKLSSEKIGEIKKLYEEDVSIQEISRRLGVSSGTAWRYTRAEELGHTSAADYYKKRAQERGFSSLKEYRDHLARERGFESQSAYNQKLARENNYYRETREELNEWAREKGFDSYTDYSRHLDSLKQLRPENRLVSGLIQMRLEQSGQSIQWLADELDVDRATVSRYYHGTRLPSEEVQVKLFETLDLPYRTIDDVLET